MEEKTDIIDNEQTVKEKITVKIFEWLDVLAIAMIFVVLMFGFVFRIATIKGGSMNNTLISGEKVFVNDLFYTPKQGDIIVISRNYRNDFDLKLTNEDTTPIIKRVIATEGQTVDIIDGYVYVDGEKLYEPYAVGVTLHDSSVNFPITVRENCVFVLGDNRGISLDSRSAKMGNYGNGQIDERYVVGKAAFRVFPFNKLGGLR